MLKNDFYTISDFLQTENSAEFTISLNSAHTIFGAHFPDNPIVPGVCIVQILKELFGTIKDADFTAQKIKNIKFTAPIIPIEHPVVNYKFEWDEKDENGLYRVKAFVYSGDIIFSKINLQLKQEEA